MAYVPYGGLYADLHQAACLCPLPSGVTASALAVWIRDVLGKPLGDSHECWGQK